MIKYSQIRDVRINTVLSSSLFINTVLTFALIIPFFFYISVIYLFSANVPFSDDYDAVLKFIEQFTEFSSFGERIQLLFAQHNEHRIVFSRIVILLQQFLLGHINFRILVFTGNLGWLLTIIVLCLRMRKDYKFSLFAILPIIYLLLSFSHMENMFFPMASISNYWVIFYLVAFLWFLVEKKDVPFTVLFALGLFTSGNGIIMYILGNVYLILRKEIRSFVFFFVISGILIFIYFWDYHSPAYHPSAKVALENPYILIQYLFQFIGNIFIIPQIAIAAGILIFACLTIFILHNNFLPKDDFLVLLAIYSIINALVTAVTRGGFGLEQGIPSRYTMYSALALTTVYLIGLRSVEDRLHIRYITFSTLVSVSFFFIILLGGYLSQSFQHIYIPRIASIGAVMRGNDTYLVYPVTADAAQRLRISRDKKIFDYTQVPLYSPKKILSETEITNNSDIKQGIDIKDTGLIAGWAFVPLRLSRDSTTQVLLSGSKGKFLIDTLRVKRIDVSQANSTPVLYDYSGFEAWIGAYTIPAGEYHIGIVIRHDSTAEYIMTEHSIEIPEMTH